ncbi:MAG: replication initiation protein RepC [Rhodobacteraceae bacterium]|nr:replication initiation protein RepC [Paracoccaceae bacterium]
MEYTAVTPFRRALGCAQMKYQKILEQPLPPNGVNKWEALRELSVARNTYALSDRDMTVLQALLSYHQGTLLGGNSTDLVIHPSNRSICERLNGMPCSTMRRHLAHLVQSGIIIRRDSPNGKRYVRRHDGEKHAFGFDLAPLAVRFEEFCEAAEVIRAAQEKHKRLRETVSLMRRDLAGLSEYGETARPDSKIWTRLTDLAILTARDLRRKLGDVEMGEIKATLIDALDEARGVLDDSNTYIMSTNGVHNEQHYQNSKEDSYESEPCLEKARGGDRGSNNEPGVTCSVSPTENRSRETHIYDDRLPNIPLGLVLASCTEFHTYAPNKVRHWHDLVRVADVVRPMMGISTSAWDEAKQHMGPEEAAVVVVAMLDRFSEIRSPGGYLRSLSAKAELGEFSCGPMIMALMRKEAA